MSEQTASTRLPLSTKVGFGLGNIGVMIGKQAPKALSLPIYNVALGVSPGWVGTVLALSRVWDAVTDPLVGHWSDRITTRWGRRKPFIFLGAMLSGLFFASIWWFPRGLTDMQYLLYYIVTSMLFYFALTVFSVPWYALGYELSEDYDERTRLMGFASFLGPAGQIMVAWLYPLTQQKAFFADTIDGVRFVGLGAGLLLAGFGLATVFMVKERPPPPAKTGRAAVAKPSFWAGVKAAAQNRPFVILTSAFTLVVVGTSMVGGLGFYVHTYYLYGGDTKLGGELTAQNMTIMLVCAVAFTPVVVRLSTRFGKKAVFTAALVWGLLRASSLWFLLDPEHPQLALVNGFLWGVDNAAVFMLCHAMIADVCDVDQLKSGERREGLFGALYGWVFKTGLALAFAVSGYILVVVGFNRDFGGAQPAETLFLMKLSYCGVPALFFLLALLIFVRYPITRAMANSVREQLDARNRAAV
jgi:glycoside/pentoside/hexuronide:cation symporter, GPH family